MAEQTRLPDAGDSARAHNVRKVREALKTQEKVEHGLRDLQAKIPAMIRDSEQAREDIEKLLPKDGEGG